MCRVVKMSDVYDAMDDDMGTVHPYRDDPPDGLTMIVNLPNLDRFDDLERIESNQQPLAGILEYIRVG